jgi:hypothetical protein
VYGTYAGCAYVRVRVFLPRERRSCPEKAISGQGDVGVGLRNVECCRGNFPRSCQDDLCSHRSSVLSALHYPRRLDGRPAPFQPANAGRMRRAHTYRSHRCRRADADERTPNNTALRVSPVRPSAHLCAICTPSSALLAHSALRQRRSFVPSLRSPARGQLVRPTHFSLSVSFGYRSDLLPGYIP